MQAGSWRYTLKGKMSEKIDLTDPGFEPTDAQLMGLSIRAFADVARRHEISLSKLRAQIVAAREQALKALETRGAPVRIMR
jgi:hypothetical protein